MQLVLPLVIALAGSSWNCTETNGLWDCRPARSMAPAPAIAPAPTSRPAPLTASPAQVPAAPAAAPLEAPAETPVEAPAATPVDGPAVTPVEAPAATPVEAPAASPALAPVAARPVETPTTDLPEAPAADASDKAFVVQVGAYRQRVDAEQAAARLDYGNPQIVPTEREGESWWVIVLGAFPSLESARTAGAEYEAETGGGYWVRNAEDLQALLAEPR